MIYSLKIAWWEWWLGYIPGGLVSLGLVRRKRGWVIWPMYCIWVKRRTFCGSKRGTVKALRACMSREHGLLSPAATPCTRMPLSNPNPQSSWEDVGPFLSVVRVYETATDSVSELGHSRRCGKSMHCLSTTDRGGGRTARSCSSRRIRRSFRDFALCDFSLISLLLLLVVVVQASGVSAGNEFNVVGVRHSGASQEGIEVEEIPELGRAARRAERVPKMPRPVP